MKQPKYPCLYQINTRVWLTELSRTLGRHATLDDIPDYELDQLATKGFDWVWLLSIWLTGESARKISRENPEWRHEFESTLPDLTEDDIGGSGFAIKGYTVHPALGGDAALSRIRERLHERGLKLMLDFVPNHMAPDHPWVQQHSAYFISGTQDELDRFPQNYTIINRNEGNIILAYGRDPYFAGWPDTLQLDYGNPATQDVMVKELLNIADRCDGVRCDMAMLVTAAVFEKTWGRKTEEFWKKATTNVRQKNPEFCFMAEVYWDMEWILQQQGFDYTYDKRLYDRLRESDAKAVREHLYAEPGYQDKMARFLENHDEPRAAAVFEKNIHKAAAIITYLSPGLRFFHQGQFEGKKKRISPHLVRGPVEPVDSDLLQFYTQLLAVIRKPMFRDGKWRLLQCNSAWEGNASFDRFIACTWEGADGALAMVVVNYAPHYSQCYIPLPFSEMAEESIKFKDLMSDAEYDRAGNELLSKGMYLDMPSWSYHVFDVKIPARMIVENNPPADTSMKSGEKHSQRDTRNSNKFAVH